MQSIIIIGGDRRQTYLRDYFTEKGFFCRHINSQKENTNLDRIGQYDTVMLPVPLTKDGEYVYSYNDILLLKLSEVFENVRKGQKVIGGSFTKEMKALLSDLGAQVLDLCDIEEFLIYNSFLTAQGAVRLLVDSTQELLVGKKVLVTGFGRLGKSLAKSLDSLGVEVYVSARKPSDIQFCECIGYKTLSFDALRHCLHFFDFIFNTVPFPIFTNEDISFFTGKYFELASKPYGADRKIFLKDNFIDGSGLPGKFTPVSAADKIGEFSLEFI